MSKTKNQAQTCPRSHPKLVMEARFESGMNSKACVLTCHSLGKDLVALTYFELKSPMFPWLHKILLWLGTSVHRVENAMV